MALLLRRAALAHALIVLYACASPTNDAATGSDAAAAGTAGSAGSAGAGGHAAASGGNSAGLSSFGGGGATGLGFGTGGTSAASGTSGAGVGGEPAANGGAGGLGGMSGSMGAAGSSGGSATNAGSGGSGGMGGSAGSSGKGGAGGVAGSGGSAGSDGKGGSGGSGGKMGSAGATNAGAGGTGGSCGQTITLAAVADASINAAAPTSNYGPVAEANIVQGGAASSERALFSFDLSSVPSGATIKSANLELTIVNNPGLDKVIAVHRVAQGSNRSWGEAQVTWQEYKTGSSWTASGGDFVAQPTDSQAVSATAAAGTVVVFQVLADAQSFYAAPGTNFGFLIKDSQEPAASSGAHVFFATREIATPDSRPKLVLTYCL